MTENELIRRVTEDYLAGIDTDIRPAPEDVERELLRRPTTPSRRTTWVPAT